MGRWALGLFLYAAIVACDDSPAPNVDGDTGVADSGGEDAGVAGDAAAAPDAAAGDASTPPDSGIEDECDPVAQTGCMAPTTKCVIEGGAPGTECEAPGPNEGGLGDPCVGLDCEAGLACVRDTDTATTAHCRMACNHDTAVGCETLGADYDCRTRITDSNWGACTMLLPTCDPYTQDPCEQDQACQPYLRRTGTWEFRCRTAGQVAEGMTCGGANACARGLACVNRNGDVACRRYCEDDTDCTAPATCSGNVPEPPFMFCDE